MQHFKSRAAISVAARFAASAASAFALAASATAAASAAAVTVSDLDLALKPHSLLLVILTHPWHTGKPPRDSPLLEA